MRYIPNNDRHTAIFYKENELTEKEAQAIIGSDWSSRDGSEWDEFNIIPAGKAYQIVDYDGEPEEDDEWYSIDPIWYCYQYREGEINYDEGSWEAAAAIKEARLYSVDKKVQAIGLRENYCCREYDIEDEEWDY